MNYGKFFRLNKNLSRIEEGYAVYDYIDLPAYFTRSIDNQMSPKYPVSMTVLADSVVFKLHYSAYKIEESSDVLPDQTDSKYPKYLYDIKDNTQNGGGSLKSGDVTKIVHMEETILELPYTDTVGRNLSDTIRDIYNTNFPLILNATDESGSNTKKKDSSGGRFLYNLIRKRYLEENVEEERDIHTHFYHSLRRISDGTPSYSTLWLMGLVMGVKDNVRYVRTDKKGNVVGFLRKLLLDFMFDLKHSDVFQNSSQFQKMFSGLMSNFYFSALMHKCEYYYYRKLTSQAIDDIEESFKIRKEDVKSNNLTNEERKKEEIFIRNERQERTKAISTLYANELIKAEDLWIQDIMNPQAEKDFEHQYPGKHKFLREIVEYYNFKQWPSWFAEPEEEMRRVCFTMRDETGKKHVCNAETLVKYLNIKSGNQDKSVKAITEIVEDNKEKISKWFLRQYDFNDVLHLHWFKHLNNIFIFVFAIPVLLSLFTREKLWDSNSFECFLYEVIGIIVLTICVWFVNDFKSMQKSDYWDVREWLVTCKGKLREWGRFVAKPRQWFDCWKKSGILKARREIVFGNIVWFIIFAVIIAFIIAFRDSECTSYNDWRIVIISYRDSCVSIINSLTWKMWVLIAFGIICLIIFLEKKLNFMKHMISCLHLFFPRLVASITMSWITLSMGFDLYVSYFDYKPSPHYILLIVVVVMLFVMYEINRITPHASPLRKFWRSFELMIISYFISLSVGFLIINFLGPKYLERGGYINDYYTQHVKENEEGTLEWTKYRKQEMQTTSETLKENDWSGLSKVTLRQLDNIESAVNDTNSHVRLVEKLQNVTIQTKSKEYKIAAVENFWGIKIFILRDFLIMFSFIAMFTGIFIQLIIFGDNKQMTEL